MPRQDKAYWKLEIVMMSILSELVALDVVIITNLSPGARPTNDISI